MAVWVRQLTDLEETDRRVIGPPEGMTDAEYLEAKLVSHTNKDWAVTPIAMGSFTATKRRHGNLLCERTFWTE